MISVFFDRQDFTIPLVYLCRSQGIVDGQREFTCSTAVIMDYDRFVAIK
jgi:hypothetical protein